jgi:hypothetical protein
LLTVPPLLRHCVGVTLSIQPPKAQHEDFVHVTFEQLRRDLGGTDGVTAVEVAPGDRLAAVLAEGRQPRQHAGGGRG